MASSLSAPTSATSSSTTGSPDLRRPSTSAAAAIATNRFTPPDSPTSTRLRGETPKNPAAEKYVQARQLLSAGKADEARVLFLELITAFRDDESNLIHSADCHIGVAYSYPEESVDRERYAIQAKTLLDTALTKTLKEDESDETIRAFQKMRVLYGCLPVLVSPDRVPLIDGSIPGLVLADRTGLLDDVKAKIEEFSRRIPVLTNFYEKLQQAQHLIVQDKLEPAREILLAVMPTILGNDSKVDFILAKAMGKLKIAFTYPEGKDRDLYALEAQAQTFTAYERKEELFTSAESKAVALSYFHILFNGLSQLIPASHAFHPEIMEKLAACRKELASLRPADGTGTEESDSETPRPVTPGPVDDYWKPARIFIAFAFAAAVIVGAAVLGRRLITRLN